MMHTIIGGTFTLADGTPLPLSKAIRAGDFILLSGQLGLDEHGKLAASFDDQVRHCLRNIESLLTGAGAGLDSVCKATVWLTDVADFPVFNRIYAAAFNTSPPVRSTVISALVLPGAKIEIEAMAYAPLGIER